MKIPYQRILGALLASSLLLSSAACTTGDLDLPLPSSADSTIESTETPPPGTEESTTPSTEEAYKPTDIPVMDPSFISCKWVHYSIETVDSKNHLYQYEIYDLDQNVVKESKPYAYVDIEILDSSVLMIKTYNPDECISYLFYHIYENKFSKEYNVDLKDASKNTMVYKVERNGKSLLVTHDPFDPAKNYHEIELDADATDCQAELLYRDNVLCIENYKNGKFVKTEYYPFSNTVVDFASYESILATYHKLIEIRPNPYQFLWDHWEEWENSLTSASVLPLFTFVSEDAKKEFYNLACLAHEYHPNRNWQGYERYTTNATATFGYTYRDLNADGSDELILLTEDYKLLAIYTMKDGKPMRVEDIWGRRLSCTIDEQNRLHLFGSSGAAYSTEKVCVLGKDGNLETIVEYGINGVDENNNLIRVKVVEDQFVVITKEECDALDKLYGIDLPEGMLAAEYMRLVVGLEFTPLEPITKLLRYEVDGWEFARENPEKEDSYPNKRWGIRNIDGNDVELYDYTLHKSISAIADGNKICFAEEGFVGYFEIFGSCAWITIEECENALYPAGTYLLPYFDPAKG